MVPCPTPDRVKSVSLGVTPPPECSGVSGPAVGDDGAAGGGAWEAAAGPEELRASSEPGLAWVESCARSGEGPGTTAGRMAGSTVVPEVFGVSELMGRLAVFGPSAAGSATGEAVAGDDSATWVGPVAPAGPVACAGPVAWAGPVACAGSGICPRSEVSGGPAYAGWACSESDGDVAAPTVCPGSDRCPAPAACSGPDGCVGPEAGPGPVTSGRGVFTDPEAGPDPAPWEGSSCTRPDDPVGTWNWLVLEGGLPGAPSGTSEGCPAATTSGELPGWPAAATSTPGVSGGWPGPTTPSPSDGWPVEAVDPGTSGGDPRAASRASPDGEACRRGVTRTRAGLPM
jgi:hypothetical protein